ncbi:MAG: EAL domain-containing protein [Sporichthyaceae bacterium]
MRATRKRATRQDRRGLPAWWAWSFVGFGAFLAVLLLLLRESPAATVPTIVAGIAGTGAILAGIGRNRPERPLPWALFAGASVSFIVGAMLRQVLAGRPEAPLSDVASLLGYALTVAAVLAILRARQSAQRGLDELIDGLIVVAAAAPVALALFTLPTAVARGHLSLFAILQGLYPVIDVVVLFVALLLFWTSADRVPAYWLLIATATGTLAGDLGYAQIGTQGKVVGSPLLDLPFILAFCLLGAAALHPSMTALSRPQRRPIQAWSRSRLAILVPALVVPGVIVVTGDRADADWAGGISGVAVALLILVRAVGAVRGYAQSQEGLRYQARHDPLTGLINRAALVTEVDELIRHTEREGGRVDLLFIDLDGFKLVNDSWGHQVGDHVLCAVADRLKALLGLHDVLARVGGDEFAVARLLAPDDDIDGRLLADAVVKACAEPLAATDTTFVTTVSVGLAESAPPATAEGLLRDADTAMYRAKTAGRNRCVEFNTSMRDILRARVETELALRYALKRDEFLLHYQPIVSLETGEAVGLEALLRWAHPKRGMVSPLEFIPVAEETGLIVDIGAWVVSEAIRQVARWRDMGRNLGWVSVNVSARQLQDSRLVAHVESELRRYAVPAELLVLEITESAMAADPDMSLALLTQLRDLGVTLAVDDFGTGYSSLSNLRRFPVAKVKIDRSFVSGIADDPDDEEIVRAVVAMSLAMKLDVVAEGIETEDQHVLLRRLGVHLGQGWLFGRPAPAEDYEMDLVVSRRA